MSILMSILGLHIREDTPYYYGYLLYERVKWKCLVEIRDVQYTEFVPSAEATFWSISFLIARQGVAIGGVLI